MLNIVVQLFGPFGLWSSDHQRIEIKSRKSEALLALLIMSPGGIATRAKLQSLLWSSRPKVQAQSSLRKELHQLRSSLGDNLKEILSISRNAVEIDLDRVRLKDQPSTVYAPESFLDGLEVFDAEGFEDWLRQTRNQDVTAITQSLRGISSTDELLISSSHGETSDQLGQKEPWADRNFVDLSISKSMRPHYLVQMPKSHSSEFQITGQLNYVANKVIDSLFSIRDIAVVDCRSGLTLQPQASKDSVYWVVVQGFCEGTLLNIQISISGWDGAVEWSITRHFHIEECRINPPIMDEVSDAIFEYIWSNQKLNNQDVRLFDVGRVIDGLYIPGSMAIDQIGRDINYAVQLSPSGRNLAIRNCARMLQFGERLDGYDNVSAEIVHEDLQKSLETSPESGLVHSIASHAFSLFLKNDSRAIDHAAKSVALNPVNPIYIAFFALALLRAGHVKEALRNAEIARSVGGTGKYAAFLEVVCCVCYAINGDFNKAISTGETALQSNPHFGVTKKYLFAAYAHAHRLSDAESLMADIQMSDKFFSFSGIKNEDSIVNIESGRNFILSATKIVGV